MFLDLNPRILSLGLKLQDLKSRILSLGLKLLDLKLQCQNYSSDVKLLLIRLMSVENRTIDA